MRTRLLVAVVVFASCISALALALETSLPKSAVAAPAVQKAIGLDEAAGDVTKYGARMRMTKGTWDYLKLTLRDTFKQWDFKGSGGKGLNLLIDSGYDPVNLTAGPIRTTPFQWRYAYYDSQDLPGFTQECGCGLLTCYCNTRNCGVSCNGWAWIDAGWIQVRKPGFNLGDTPGIPWQCWNSGGFQEYGFYVPSVGSPGGGPCNTPPTYGDFNEFQACSDHYNYDTGSGKTGRCTTAGMSLVLDTLHYNARIFIFPNMRQENADVLDPNDNWNPASVAVRGPYGYNPDAPNWSNRVYSTINNCTNGGYCTSAGTQCCDTICTCGDWGICAYTTRYNPNCNAYQAPRNYNAHFTNLPQTTGAYNPASRYHETDGTYFRAGDDTAVYLNIYQMQIQSADRANAYRPATCGKDVFYTGLSGGVPRYVTDDQDVRNCMRPKMYWYDDPLDAAKSRWKQCEPFDTWNTDGTLNPNNDDDKYLYPGNPATGRGADGINQVSWTRCGRQACTWGNCVSSASGWAWVYNSNPALNSRTANLNDLYSDNDGQGNPHTGRVRGTGWYGLKLDPSYPRLNPGSNRIDIQFSGKDVRLELAIEADIYTGLTGGINNKVAFGRLLVQTLTVNASLNLYSIDDKSCVNGNPGSCSGFWKTVNAASLLSAGTINPDKLVVDAVINSVNITPANGGAWFQGSSTCLAYWIWPWQNDCIITMEGILNNSLIQGQLIPPIEDAVKGALAGALGDITSVVPNLNGVLGNPINMGTALIDTGIFLTGNPADYELVNPPNQYPRRWPVRITQGPAGDGSQNNVDMRMSVGFKPIAFKMPPGANGVMDIDTAAVPAATSIYGVPELWEPATRHASLGNCALSSAGDTCPGGVYTNGPGCALPAHYAQKDADQTIDADDYCRGRPGFTTDAFYYNPKSPNTKVYVAYPNAIPEYWKGPISKYNKPPDWCMVVGANQMPTTLRSGAAPANMAALFPNNSWLSFDSVRDIDPRDGLAKPRNTIGLWDQMPGNSVLQQGTYTFDGNTGALDPNPITYDFSMHVHQRVLNQFAQALLASGVGCLEFASQDTLGADTPWKDLLAAERFAAFLPEITSLFPDSYVKVRIMPTKMPRIRVGMGNLNFTPLSRVRDSVNGALPVVNQPYTLSAAIPDLQVQVLATDPKTNQDVPLVTLKWNTVIGMYAKAVRQCYYLEGLANAKDEFGQPVYTGDSCRSPYTNKRRVSGYYEIFVDLNGERLNRDASGKLTASGLDKVGDAWELPGNAVDGFPDGKFTNKDFPCPECVPSVPVGSTMFEVTQNFCVDKPAKCSMIGFAQAIPTLLSSTIQMFFVTRLNFYNLTIDFLYVGPDGPDDDGLGTPKAYPFDHIDGDYLGIYARFLGDLNVFGLLDTVTLLAPQQGRAFVPQVKLADLSDGKWVRTSKPVFNVKLDALGKLGNSPSFASYTYSLDDGFWHTPVDYEELHLSGLTEGQHTLKIRSFEDSQHTSAANLTPTVLKFVVDTLPPVVTILPSKKGYFSDKALVQAKDLQTPADRIKFEYSWDDSEWEEFSGESVSISRKAGRHTLRVRATDLAGNVGESAREIVVDGKGWGCSAGGHTDASMLLILLALFGLGIRRQKQ